VLSLQDGWDRVTVGRGAAADVSLPWDSEVSRVHAELLRLGDDWAVVDDGLSGNGTSSTASGSSAADACSTATNSGWGTRRCASRRRFRRATRRWSPPTIPHVPDDLLPRLTDAQRHAHGTEKSTDILSARRSRQPEVLIPRRFAAEDVDRAPAILRPRGPAGSDHLVGNTEPMATLKA
jgi:hypothetical protein